jgi:hypothetical protein
MTAAEKAKLFGSVFAMLDSDQPGERTAALDKLHALRGKMGWWTFADLLQRLESVVSPEQLEAAERSAADWERAHNERVKENGALARRNAALVARNGTLHAALWVMMNWRKVAMLGLVLTVGSGGGWWWWKNAEAAPDKPVAATDDRAQAAVDAELRDRLSRTKWGVDDTAPAIATLNGVPYWVVVRGNVDAQSHVDAQGHPVERHCLQLFASKAEADAGAFVTPSPYVAFGIWLKWPQRAAECRMPGTRNYP